MSELIIPKAAQIALFIEHCRHQLNSGKRTISLPEHIKPEDLKKNQEWKAFLYRITTLQATNGIVNVTIEKNTVTFEEAPT